MLNPSDGVHWFRQTNLTRWEIDLQNIELGNSSIWVSERRAVIDTFFKTLALPNNEWNNFKQYIITNIPSATCDNVKGTCQINTACSNAQNLPTLTF